MKNFYKTIGDKIQKVRRDKKISQKALAQKMGQGSATYINLIESGKRKVSLYAICEISKALEVPLNHFLEKDYNELNAYELIEIALISIKNINVSERKTILDFIHFLEEKNKPESKQD